MLVIRRIFDLALIFSALAFSMQPVNAAHNDGKKYSVLHTFAGGSEDGQTPQYGSPAVDKHGNLYGVAYQAGSDACANGCGVAYKITKDGTYSILHFFNGTDGAKPLGGLIYDDTSGMLYGTTSQGGNGTGCGSSGCGTIYSLAPNGKYKVLYNFQGGINADGNYPAAAPIRDKQGNLYGTASSGGVGGYGTVWKLKTNGTLSVLASFNYANGSYLNGPLLRHKDGTLYGTYTVSGESDVRGGVYRIAADGTYTLLHSFYCPTDGCYPYGRLIEDDDGNIYGTASDNGPSCDSNGCGTVWKLAPDNTFSVIHSFSSADPLGTSPYGGLVLSKNKLYGMTSAGGASSGSDCPCGTAYKIGIDGSGAAVLHDFTGYPSDAGTPYSELVSGPKKYLYGDTYHGGPGNVGAVFRVKQ